MLSAFYNLKAIFYNPPGECKFREMGMGGGGGAIRFKLNFVENTQLFIKIKIWVHLLWFNLSFTYTRLQRIRWIKVQPNMFCWCEWAIRCMNLFPVYKLHWGSCSIPRMRGKLNRTQSCTFTMTWLLTVSYCLHHLNLFTALGSIETYIRICLFRLWCSVDCRRRGKHSICYDWSSNYDGRV